MKCKHHKHCNLFSNASYTCNNRRENEYCGMYRELNKKKKEGLINEIL